jgi:hypothetical protein
LRSGKFRKNIKKFNIIEAVEKVMSVQRLKAKSQNIEFKAIYINIREGNG